VSLYIKMTIYQQGLENAFGGAFAPLESVRDKDGALHSEFAPTADFDASGPADRERKVFITDAVRQKVTADLQGGARRRGY
jgi:hypothetical protein